MQNYVSLENTHGEGSSSRNISFFDTFATPVNSDGAFCLCLIRRIVLFPFFSSSIHIVFFVILDISYRKTTRHFHVYLNRHIQHSAFFSMICIFPIQ